MKNKNEFNIVDMAEYLASVPLSVAINEENSILLIRTYSQLYLNGAQCRTCLNSMKKYYETIKNNGKKMAIQLTEARNRTCKPNWVGIKYIKSLNEHIDSYMLTDFDAINYIRTGVLKESNFEILPKNLLDIDIIECKITEINKISDNNIIISRENGIVEDIKDVKKIEEILNNSENSILITSNQVDFNIKLSKEDLEEVKKIRASQTKFDSKLSKDEKKCSKEFNALFKQGLTVDEIFNKYKHIKKIGVIKYDEVKLKELINISKNL